MSSLRMVMQNNSTVLDTIKNFDKSGSSIATRHTALVALQKAELLDLLDDDSLLSELESIQTFLENEIGTTLNEVSYLKMRRYDDLKRLYEILKPVFLQMDYRSYDDEYAAGLKQLEYEKDSLNVAQYAIRKSWLGLKKEFGKNVSFVKAISTIIRQKRKRRIFNKKEKKGDVVRMQYIYSYKHEKPSHLQGYNTFTHQWWNEGIFATIGEPTCKKAYDGLWDELVRNHELLVDTGGEDARQSTELLNILKTIETSGLENFFQLNDMVDTYNITFPPGINKSMLLRFRDAIVQGHVYNLEEYVMSNFDTLMKEYENNSLVLRDIGINALYMREFAKKFLPHFVLEENGKLNPELRILLIETFKDGFLKSHNPYWQDTFDIDSTANEVFYETLDRKLKHDLQFAGFNPERRVGHSGNIFEDTVSSLDERVKYQEACFVADHVSPLEEKLRETKNQVLGVFNTKGIKQEITEGRKKVDELMKEHVYHRPFWKRLHKFSDIQEYPDAISVGYHIGIEKTVVQIQDNGSFRIVVRTVNSREARFEISSQNKSHLDEVLKEIAQADNARLNPQQKVFAMKLVIKSAIQAMTRQYGKVFGTVNEKHFSVSIDQQGCMILADENSKPLFTESEIDSRILRGRDADLAQAMQILLGIFRTSQELLDQKAQSIEKAVDGLGHDFGIGTKEGSKVTELIKEDVEIDLEGETPSMKITLPEKESLRFFIVEGDRTITRNGHTFKVYNDGKIYTIEYRNGAYYEIEKERYETVQDYLKEKNYDIEEIKKLGVKFISHFFGLVAKQGRSVAIILSNDNATLKISNDDRRGFKIELLRKSGSGGQITPAEAKNTYDNQVKSNLGDKKESVYQNMSMVMGPAGKNRQEIYVVNEIIKTKKKGLWKKDETRVLEPKSLYGADIIDVPGEANNFLNDPVMLQKTMLVLDKYLEDHYSVGNPQK